MGNLAKVQVPTSRSILTQLGPSIISDLASQIATRAEGVFLWVKLVVDEVLEQVPLTWWGAVRTKTEHCGLNQRADRSPLGFRSS